jgi:hypothetical protein
MSQVANEVVSILTKNSSVRPISKMDLGPDATTATGVRPSSVRSADTSIAKRNQIWQTHSMQHSQTSPPRCTPPKPPVAKTRIPARCARTIVPAIVVPPYVLEAQATAISLLETLTLGFASASSTNCSFESPTCTFPRRTSHRVRQGMRGEH